MTAAASGSGGERDAGGDEITETGAALTGSLDGAEISTVVSLLASQGGEDATEVGEEARGEKEKNSQDEGDGGEVNLEEEEEDGESLDNVQVAVSELVSTEHRPSVPSHCKRRTWEKLSPVFCSIPSRCSWWWHCHCRCQHMCL